MTNKIKRAYVNVIAIAGIIFLNTASIIFSLLIADIIDNNTADNEVIWLVARIFFVVSIVFSLGVWFYHHYFNQE